MFFLRFDYIFQELNILYVDAPIGAGFSYSETQEGYYTNDTQTTEHLYDFLQKVHIFYGCFLFVTTSILLLNLIFLVNDFYASFYCIFYHLAPFYYFVSVANESPKI